jgi:hypothetical protein
VQATRFPAAVPTGAVAIYQDQHAVVEGTRAATRLRETEQNGMPCLIGQTKFCKDLKTKQIIKAFFSKKKVSVFFLKK